MSTYIATSAIHGFGTFASTSIDKNANVGIIFMRINKLRIFSTDFAETIFARFINHSENANTLAVLRPNDIIIETSKKINVNDEITLNYEQFINLFENDITAIKLVQFW